MSGRLTEVAGEDLADEIETVRTRWFRGLSFNKSPTEEEDSTQSTMESSTGAFWLSFFISLSISFDAIVATTCRSNAASFSVGASFFIAKYLIDDR